MQVGYQPGYQPLQKPSLSLIKFCLLQVSLGLHKCSNKENLLGFCYNTDDTDRGINRYTDIVIEAIVMEMWTACGTGGTVVQSVLAWILFFPTPDAKMFYFLLYLCHTIPK